MTHVLLKAKKRCLNLSNCNLGEASAQVIAGQLMMFNPNFASYNLEFNELGDAGVGQRRQVSKRIGSEELK